MDGKKERKGRKPNFPAAECNLLLKLAEEYLETIREKFTKNLTNKRKQAIWQSISDKVNAPEIAKRTPTEVRENGEHCVGWHGKNSTRKRSLKKKLGMESHHHSLVSLMPLRKKLLSCFGPSLDFPELKAVLSQVTQVCVKLLMRNKMFVYIANEEHLN